MTKALSKQEHNTAITTPSTPRLGFDNFDVSELIVPRLRLLQALSESVSEGTGKAGEFQDSLSSELLGEEVEVVLLGMKNGAVYFETGEGLKCRSVDGRVSVNGDLCEQCPFGEYHGKFHEDGTPPKCASSKEFMSVTKGTIEGKEQRPLVISFMKTSYKEGKKLASMAYLAGGNIFNRSYKLASVKDKNDKGAFYIMKTSVGQALNQSELAEATRWYNILSTSKVRVVGDEGQAANNEVVHDEV